MRLSPYQKRWWSRELADKHAEVHRLTCNAYNRRACPNNPAHDAHKSARKAYSVMIEIMKRWHWEGFLESVRNWYGWLTGTCWVTPQMEEGHAYPPSKWYSRVRQLWRQCKMRTRVQPCRILPTN